MKNESLKQCKKTVIFYQYQNQNNLNTRLFKLSVDLYKHKQKLHKK